MFHSAASFAIYVLINAFFLSTEGAVRSCRPEDGVLRCIGGCFFRLDTRFDKDCSTGIRQIVDPNRCMDNEQMIGLEERCSGKERATRIFGYAYTCSPNEFKCEKSGICLPRWRVLDGRVDCTIGPVLHFGVTDSSDEEKGLVCNPMLEFSCTRNENLSARCIPREWVGDRYFDCNDNGLDETMKLPKCYNETEFQCGSEQRCLPRHRVMDGFYDCYDRSDEIAPLKCFPQKEHRCLKTGRCIPRSWRRNNIIDCPMRDDELPLLENETCKNDEFRCLNNERCVPLDYLCDGFDQCGDCSDEVEGCPTPIMFRCPKDPLRKCVRWEASCDNKRDCPNMTDDITSVVGFKCYRDQFSTGLHRSCVIPQHFVKDSKPFCNDGADVCYKNGTFVCWMCLDQVTILSPSQVCDGVFDCPDLSDECLCFTKLQISSNGILCNNVCYEDTSTICEHCSKGKIYCNRDAKCIEKSLVCDGNIDCQAAGEDEATCSNNPVESSSGKHDFNCDPLAEGVLDFLKWAFSPVAIDIALSITTAKRCDGKVECHTFEDECSERANCSVKPEVCNEIPLQSTNGNLLGFKVPNITIRRCSGLANYIVGYLICNGINDCVDHIDERYCPDRFNCDAGFVPGIAGNKVPLISIPKHKVCDGKPDCSQTEDETNCSTTTHFYCESGSVLFVDAKKVLDGKADCDDQSDECPETYLNSSSISSNRFLVKSPMLRVWIWIMAAVALIANAVVIYSTVGFLAKSKKIAKKQRNTTALINKGLVLNLSAADFLMGIVLLIIILKSFQFEGRYCFEDKPWRTSNICNLIGVLTVLSSEVSIFTLVVLTTYRLYFTAAPYKSLNAKKSLTWIWISLTWVISLILALIPLSPSLSSTMITQMWIKHSDYFSSDVLSLETLQTFTKRITALSHKNTTAHNVLDSWFKMETYLADNFPDHSPRTLGYFGYYSASGLCIPRFYRSDNDSSPVNGLSSFLIVVNFLALVYIVLAYAAIYRSATSNKPGASSSAAADQQRSQSIRLQRKITTLIATDLCCWLPICFMTFVSMAGVTLPPEAYAVSAVVLLPINSSMNPLIYTDAFGLMHKKLVGWGSRFRERLTSIFTSLRRLSVSQSDKTEASEFSGDSQRKKSLPSVTRM